MSSRFSLLGQHLRKKSRYYGAFERAASGAAKGDVRCAGLVIALADTGCVSNNAVANVLLEFANACMASKRNLRDGLHALETVLSLQGEPPRANTLNAVGKILMHLGRPKDAVIVLQQAVNATEEGGEEKVDENFESMLNLCTACSRAGRHAKAARLAAQALAKMPKEHPLRPAAVHNLIAEQAWIDKGNHV